MFEDEAYMKKIVSTHSSLGLATGQGGVGYHYSRPRTTHTYPIPTPALISIGIFFQPPSHPNRGTRIFMENWESKP